MKNTNKKSAEEEIEKLFQINSSKMCCVCRHTKKKLPIEKSRWWKWLFGRWQKKNGRYEIKSDSDDISVAAKRHTLLNLCHVVLLLFGLSVYLVAFSIQFYCYQTRRRLHQHGKSNWIEMRWTDNECLSARYSSRPRQGNTRVCVCQCELIADSFNVVLCIRLSLPQREINDTEGDATKANGEECDDNTQNRSREPFEPGEVPFYESPFFLFYLLHSFAHSVVVLSWSYFRISALEMFSWSRSFVTRFESAWTGR